MKTLVIWDLHWLNVWKELIKKDNYDKVIFLWDYVDSFIVPSEDILQNLKDIIQYKKDNLDKVELLLGNHDIQYMYTWNRCSWYRANYSWELHLIFMTNKNLFKICHQEWKYLFSHAGFTKEYEEYVYEETNKEVFKFTSYDSYNKLIDTRYQSLLFNCWVARWGHYKAGSMLWADKSETKHRGKLIDFIQVVWHTPVKSIERYDHIIYCDTLEHWDWIPLILNI